MPSRTLVICGWAILTLSGLGRAVPADFRFTVTSDPHGKTAGFGNVLAAINNLVGGPGAFHVSSGDYILFTGNIANARAVIDQNFGASFLWYPLIGNHDVADINWLRDEYNHGNGLRTPLEDSTNQDGPASTKETTFTWDYGNAHFVFLNEFWNGSSDTGTDGDVVPALYDWLAADLAANRQRFTFVFGHEPAFPYIRHVGDSLDKYPSHRDAFWQLLEDHDVDAYLCGHTHFYSTHRGDQNHVGDVWQINPAAAGLGGINAGPDMFLEVAVGDSDVTFSAYENSGGWHLLDTIEIFKPSVLARQVFYNNSASDGNDPAADPRDDLAIAIDKEPLLPGETAGFGNYTSYIRGINGAMIDVSGFPGTPTAADFLLKVGNTDDPETWAPAPAPASVTVRPGEGVDDSDRVTILWDDNAIENQWLQITLLANETTGLAEDDVFYFGNAVGETGNSTTDAKVNAFDMLGARDNPRSFLNPAPIHFAFDFNRDARVNATDMLIARDRPSSFLNALRLITPPAKAAHVRTAAVPEPASVTLLGIAGVFLLLRARRSSQTLAGSRRTECISQD